VPQCLLHCCDGLVTTKGCQANETDLLLQKSLLHDLSVRSRSATRLTLQQTVKL